MPNELQQKAFERLAKNKDMKDILSFYEDLISKAFSVNTVTTLKDLIASQKALKFIQEELIDRFKNYMPAENRRMLGDDYY
jgi:hypothetical protein